MIGVKPVNEDPQEFEDVNSDIHKEYNLLVFKYAQLLREYLDISKRYAELLDHDNQVMKELIDIKERYLNDRTTYKGVSEM